MVREIIQIDKALCDGCGLCVEACHEGAIGLVDGRAQLLRDDYCDGLGNCLPVCPTGAITFTRREAEAYDEAAVKANMAGAPLPHGCPGTAAKTIRRPAPPSGDTGGDIPSALEQWPVQLRLVPSVAPYFDGAHLLVAADCTAYAYGGIHRDFMAGKITVIGCPKLDEGAWAEKLSAIIKMNQIASLTVLRMVVPCCAGIANVALEAVKSAGKDIPCRVVTIGTDGAIVPT